MNAEDPGFGLGSSFLFRVANAAAWRTACIPIRFCFTFACEGGSFMRISVRLAFNDARHRWRRLCGLFLMIRECRPAQSFARIRHSAGAAIFLLLLSSAGHAASELIRADPWQIIHITRELGPAEVQRDGMNDAQIRGEVDGQS